MGQWVRREAQMEEILMKRSFKRMTALVLAVFILTACGQQAGEEEAMRIQSKTDVRL